MNINKDKIDKLDTVIAELKTTQEWLMERTPGKNPVIKFMIEYASSLREYLLTDTTVSHHGRLGATYKFKYDSERHYLIEDSKNPKVLTFVRKMNMMVFDCFKEMNAFRTLPSRAGVTL